jgi:hypothetical protein
VEDESGKKGKGSKSKGKAWAFAFHPIGGGFFFLLVFISTSLGDVREQEEGPRQDMEEERR